MQVAEAPVPDNVQNGAPVGPTNTPVLLVLKVKDPPGVIGLPAADVSVTVTVQDDAVLTVTGLVQSTVVLVERVLT